jgi:hypothetical protein
MTYGTKTSTLEWIGGVSGESLFSRRQLDGSEPSY